MISQLPNHPMMDGVAQVEDERLDRDVYYRFQFLAQFLDFKAEDVQTIREHRELLNAAVHEFVIHAQMKVLSFDTTRKLLMGRLQGYTGELETDITQLSMTSKIISLRTTIFDQILMNYLFSNFDEEYFSKTMPKMLVLKWGNPYLDVQVVHNDACYLSGQIKLTEIVLKSNLPEDKKNKLLMAVNKALSIYINLTNMALIGKIDVPEEEANDLSTDESVDEGYLY
jgi:hypothetical protein